MNAIEIKNLTKKYIERIAVDNLSLDVKEKELFSLLGLNGAGKTTTIKMLCGLLEPTSGDATILGESIKNSKIKDYINVSPQETAIAPNLTVYENIELIAQVYGVKKDKISNKVNQMLKMFNLEDRKNDYAKKLSGGMQRRLSIAMALTSDPKVLFLDEPTLGLDVRSRRELWHIIEELKSKMTIILTTHYLEEAEALSDRIAIMDNGKLIIVGTAQELKKKANKDNIEEAFLELTEKGVA